MTHLEIHRNSYALGLRKHVFDCFLAASSNAIKYQSPLTAVGLGGTQCIKNARHSLQHMNKISFGKLGYEPLRAHCWRESAAPPCAPSLRGREVRSSRSTT